MLEDKTEDTSMKATYITHSR